MKNVWPCWSNANGPGRKTGLLAARLRRAQLKFPNACLEDIDYALHRGLKRAQIEQVRAGEWIQNHRNCLILGPTGIGKTYLGCAFGVQACRDGFRTVYFTAPKLFRDLQQAHADGSLTKLLKSIQKARLVDRRRSGRGRRRPKTVPRLPRDPR